MPSPQRVATRPHPLHDRAIGCGVDHGERQSNDGYPDFAETECNIATPPRQTERDCRNRTSLDRVNPGDASVTLIEHPKRPCTSSKKAWLRSGLDCSDDLSAVSINSGHEIMLLARDPYDLFVDMNRPGIVGGPNS